jgi:hypothetical protein
MHETPRAADGVPLSAIRIDTDEWRRSWNAFACSQECAYPQVNSTPDRIDRSLDVSVLSYCLR